MKFEVYCDESMTDLFTSKKAENEFLIIGSLWLHTEYRNEVKERIKVLRKKHNAWGEIKWTKVSHSKLDFYFELIDLFISYKSEMRFRSIAVNKNQVNMHLHENDKELGFYKFYYQLLHHWIYDFNEYSIFTDLKSNKKLDRLHTLCRCLSKANLSSDIKQIQGLPSKQVVLIQLSDLLLGIASSRMNKTLNSGSAKEKLVSYLEKELGVTQIIPTSKSEEKFNLFKIDLKGGW